MVRMRTLTTCCLAALLGVGVAGPISAAPFEQSALASNVATMPLGPALSAFAQREHLHLVYLSKIAEGVRTRGAPAGLSPEATLQKLLEGTGLSYRFLNAKTVTIFVTPSKAALDLTRNTKPAVAQAGAAPAVTALQTVIVTGSRLPVTATEGPQQVQVYTSRDIAQSGQSTVTDFLNTLPTVSMAVTEAGYDTLNGAGTVRLRGLPIGATLVLLDGRAVEGAGSGQNGGNAFDLNTIPLAAVERIEVLPEAASAVYGSDAIGGVVNVILKKDLNGGEANVTTGSPANGNYRDTTASFAWGKTFARGDVTVVASYQTRGALLTNDLSQTANQNYTRYGGIDERTTTCDPGNVYSVDGSNLPGLSSSQAGIPANGGGNLVPSDFIATSGTLNKCSPGAYGGTIIPSTHRSNLMVNGNYQVSDNTQAFFNAMYSSIDQRSYFGPATTFQQFVPANNPFNPFKVPVLVDYLFANEDRQAQFAGPEVFTRVLAGLKGHWGDNWQWNVATWRSADHQTGTAPNTINYAALSSALANTNPTQSINLFTSGVPASQTVLNDIFYSPPEDSSSVLQSVNGYVSGSLFDLPAGSVDVVLGGEYDYTQQSLYAPAIGLTPESTYSRNDKSVFGEIKVPLLGDPNAIAGQKLVLTMAGRYDDYSDFGGHFTPEAGLEFRPTDTLLLRASYSEAFKAPDIGAISEPLTSMPGTVIGPDPLRGGQIYPVTFESGGNVNLKPQTGSSRSVGFVWASKAIENLQIGLTNFRVALDNRIVIPSPFFLVDYPNAFPGTVTRAAPTAADIASGYAGVITTVNDSQLNFGSLVVNGNDLNVNYKFDTAIGTFSPSLDVTEIYKYVADVTPDTALQNRLGFANADAFATRWKGTVAMGYSAGPWSARIAGRYISSYVDYDLARALGDFWLYDASLHYDFSKGFAGGDSLLSKAYANVTVVNLFNRQPQFTDYFGTGYDPRMADVVGRSVMFTVGTRW
ncbi:MAG: TonB-dependent receptor domain-containing protein [Rhodanobacter sp.]